MSLELSKFIREHSEKSKNLYDIMKELIYKLNF